MNSDWQVGKSLTEVNQHLLDKQLKCDVTFIFPKDDGIGRSIGAHALFLTSRSPVFDVMYSERWTETPESRNVRIDDATYENFKEFLRYIYTDICDINAENVLALLYLSQKYIITTLEEKCTKYAEEELNENNACTLYQKSTEFNASELKLRSFEFICNNASAVFKSEDIGSLSQDNMLNIVSSNYLCCVNESAIFLGCLNWADAVNNARNISRSEAATRECLGPILYQVRFTLLSTQSLVDLIGRTWIVSPEEKGHLLSHCGVGESHPDMKFCSYPRAYNKFQIDRFAKLSSHSHKRGVDIKKTKDRLHSLKFQVSYPILLMGITLQSGITSDSQKILESGTLTIHRIDHDEPILSVKIEKRLGDDTVDVTFKTLVSIDKMITHVISFEYEAPPEYVSTFQSWGPSIRKVRNSSSVCLSHNPNFTFTNSDNPESHTTVTSGQFSKFEYGITLPGQ